MKHQLHCSPGSSERMIGCSLDRACAVACWPGSRRSSRRGRTPGRCAGAARRRPSRRQSSQPSTEAGSSVTLIVSRWVQLGCLGAHGLSDDKAVKSAQAGNRTPPSRSVRGPCRRRAAPGSSAVAYRRPVGERELEAHAVLERDHAARPSRVCGPAVVKRDVRGAGQQQLVAVAQLAVVAEEARDERRRRRRQQRRGRRRRRRSGRRSGSAAGRPAPMPRRGRGRPRASRARASAGPARRPASSAARTSGSRPANGSSSSSTSGLTASTRARWTRRRSPPDSVGRRALRQMRGPDRLQRLARALRSLRRAARPTSPAPPSGWRAPSAGPSRPTAARPRRCRRARSCPASASSAPDSASSSVDLPAPLGPSSATSSPAAQLQVDVVQHRAGAAGDGQPGRAQQRLAGAVRVPGGSRPSSELRAGRVGTASGSRRPSAAAG